MIQASIRPTSDTVANGKPLVAHLSGLVRDIRQRNQLSKILVITPSSYSAFFLKRAVTDTVCETSGTGLFNVEFMRIADVADLLYDATPNRLDKPSLSPLLAFELFHEAITSRETRGPLTEHAENDSTIAAVQRTIEDLALLDIGTDAALRDLVNRSNSAIYPQLLEIYRRYRLGADRYVSRHEKVRIAGQTITHDPSITSRVLAQDIIIAKPSAAPDVHATLWETLQQLPTATSINITPDVPDDSNDPDAHRQTCFYSTMGAADEPRALIRNIVEDARNGIRFGEMAVFYPSSDYASRIKDALDAAGIANCGPSIRTLADTAAGKFIALFLTMLSEDMRRAAFASWISSSPVINPITKSRVPSVPWEIASRHAKISSFNEETNWEHSLDRYAGLMEYRARRASAADEFTSGSDPEALDEAARNARFLKRFVTNLSELTDTSNLTVWSQWVEWLDKITATYLAPEDNKTEGYEQIQDALNQVRQLDEVSNSSVNRDQFSRTLRRLLQTSVGASSGWGSSVLVAPLSAGTGTAFKSVHILGMAEGILPGPGRSDPLLPDSLKLQLDSDGERLLTKKDHLKYNHDTFQMALYSAPYVRMYWNKSLLGATNESYPSPWFVNEIQKAHNQTNVPVKSLMDPKSDYVEPVTALSELSDVKEKAPSKYEFGLNDVAIRSNRPGERATLLADPSFANLAAGHQISASRASDIFGPSDGYVGNTNINSLPVWETSATALESYAKCPYNYFLAHELKVDERIDPEESLTLSPLDRGILVHSILEKFLASSPVDRSATGRHALREIATAELDRFQKEQFIGYDAIFDLEKVQITRDLETWHRTHLSILDGYEDELLTEESFGFDADSLGQFQLKDGFLVQFRGKIDLIAIAPERDRALVFDFKTGTRSYSEIKSEDITDSGKRLQLPIYSSVASHLLGNTVDIQSAFWFVFVSGSTQLRPTNKVHLMDALDQFEPELETLVNGIRSGAFPANPGGRSSFNNCTYCPYDAVCTSDRLIAWDRKKSDPVLEKYVQLAEKPSN